MKVAVIGTGYVGLVTGTVLADLGNDVICVDKDESKLAKLSKCIPTIYEPGLEEVLRRSVHDGFLKFSNSVSGAAAASEVVFIAVGTPPGPDGSPDLSAVCEVAAEIALGIKSYTVVVNKSTVPVGSGDLVADVIRANGVSDELFDVVSNPEFLREGSAIRDTRNPDRVVIGARTPEAADKLKELYAPLDAPVFVTDIASAELIKYASNAFLAAKISFINAISRVCEKCGANVDEVAKGMGADQRIGPRFLQAGLGWGGSCFPKDVAGLIKVSEDLGYDFELLKSVVKINDEQTLHFIKRLEDRLGGFEGKAVGLLGLAFKPNTDDIRDAKSLTVISAVVGGGGRIKAYDPIASDAVKAKFPDVEIVCNVYDVGEDTDALVVVTEWDEFRQLDLERLGQRMKSRIMFDGRRVYHRAACERAHFDYFAIGC